MPLVSAQPPIQFEHFAQYLHNHFQGIIQMNLPALHRLIHLQLCLHTYNDAAVFGRQSAPYDCLRMLGGAPDAYDNNRTALLELHIIVDYFLHQPPSTGAANAP
jgi:hypothetical protein